MSRRQLPAPPLVLQPVLCRLRRTSSAAPRLLDLARFLERLEMLTDGGRLNLGKGLLGRGDVLSLTTQDVRSGAHALALELLAESDPTVWAEIAERYNRAYDRGKPRRPNRLQRLFVEWSRDLGALGMVEACLVHPHLWSELERSLACIQPQDKDRQLLLVALEVLQRQGWEPWRLAFEQSCAAEQRRLLELLPLLPHPDLTTRLRWLEESVGQSGGTEAHLLAARQAPPGSVLELPEALRSLALQLLVAAPSEADPHWLAALRGYRWPAEDLDRLRGALTPDDPIHRIVYGARPGQPWLAELVDGLSS